MAKKSQQAIERLESYLKHIEEIQKVREYRNTLWGRVIDPTEDSSSKQLVASTPTDASDVATSGDYDNEATLAGQVTKSGFVIPPGIKLVTISGGRVYPPSGSRSEVHRKRIEAALASNYKGFVSVDTDKFHFLNGQKQNKFAPDYAQILYLLYDALVRAGFIKAGQKIQVNSGLRTKVDGDSKWSAHRCGCAVDIGCTGKDRYLVANTAWGIGLRGIAVGRTFVHVDCGPEGHWSYPGVPKYMGPK